MTTIEVNPHKSAKKSWTEKLNTPAEARIEKAKGRWAEKFGEGNFLIPTPALVNELICKIPRGHLATINMMREELAKQFHVDYTCPITTGIFTWIISNAAEEARVRGDKEITPWWRIVKDDGGLNPKSPGGAAYQEKLLRAEGFKIVKKSLHSEKPVVRSVNTYLVSHF